MKLTNKHDLPAPILAMIAQMSGSYSKGNSSYSMTGLIAPPRVARLRELFADQIEEDAADMISILYGQALHNYIQNFKPGEEYDLSNWIFEERLFAELDGVVISGQIDARHRMPAGNALWDWKMTSVWSVMNAKKEWEEQLNMYRWLVETVTGERVVSLNIGAFMKDHVARDAGKGDYPAAAFQRVEIDIWTMDEAEAFIRECLDHHQASKLDAAIGGLAECTPADMWMSDPVFAVMKEGRKSAIRLLPIREEAEALALEKGGYVQERKAEPKRCMNYCNVAQFCDQFKQYQKESEA